MNIGFDRPAFLALGALAFIVAACFRRLRRDAFILGVALGAPGGVPFSPPVNFNLLMKALGALEFAGAVLLAVAAAGPHVLNTRTVHLNRGADVLFVLDVSPSMAAQDMDGGARFHAGAALIRDFALRRPADAVGLVAVGSDAALLVPPTTDRAVFGARLDALQIGELGDGTALGMGLALAALHLNGSTAPRKAAVLITDGENNAGAVHPEAAAAMLADSGASLWVIGVGSEGEVAIDYVDPVSRVHRTGSFDSRFADESLQAIAEAGGGFYLSAPSLSAFTDAFFRLDDGERVERKTALVTRTESATPPLLLAALGLLAFARLVRLHLLGAPL